MMSDTYFIICVVCFFLSPPFACWVYPRGRTGVILWIVFALLSASVCNNPSDFGLMDEIEYNEVVSTRIWFLYTVWNVFWMFVGDRLSKEDRDKIS
jgi:hypothetical protein